MTLHAERNGTTGPFEPSPLAKLVREPAGGFGLPALDASRHGGMTERAEAN